MIKHNAEYTSLARYDPLPQTKKGAGPRLRESV